MTLPDWLQAPMQEAARGASDRFRTGTPVDQTYVPFAPETEQALQRTMQVSNDPRAGGQAGLQQLNDTLTGQYLHGGAGFDRAFAAAADTITPRVTSAFNQANRMGGVAGQSELTRQLGNSFAALYDNERNRQMSGLSLAPTVQQSAYDPVMRQLGVGQLREAKDMERLQDSLYRNNFKDVSLDQYIQRLAMMAPSVQGQTTTSKGGGGSTLGKLAGVAMIGAGAFFGGPAGAAAGASVARSTGAFGQA